MGHWEQVAVQSNGAVTEDDFEAAAYRLATEQVLYYADIRSRTAFNLVERYERRFKEALVPLGVEVRVNRPLRYAYALPRHGKAGTASKDETVLALVLRAIYDESAREGAINEYGEVICDTTRLDESHRLLAGREMPSTRGRFEALMDSMKRWGIARMATEEDVAGEVLGDGYLAIVVRPAIVEILSEGAMQRLALFKPVLADVAEHPTESIDPVGTAGLDEPHPEPAE